MLTIVDKVKMTICQHEWQIDYEYDVLTGKMHKYRYCTKCGKVD